VERAFEYRLGDLDFYADGSSPFEFEAEPTSAVMQSVHLGTASPPIVIATDEKSITFTITVKALVAFEAEFRFQHDNVTLGFEAKTRRRGHRVSISYNCLSRDIYYS